MHIPSFLNKMKKRKRTLKKKKSQIVEQNFIILSFPIVILGLLFEDSYHHPLPQFPIRKQLFYTHAVLHYPYSV